MKILWLLFSFLFIQSNQILYNKISDSIMNKIENRDYGTINITKSYTKITLALFEEIKSIKVEIEEDPSELSGQKNFGFAIISYDNKPINKILKEIEMNIKKIIQNNNSFLMFYYHEDFKRDPIIAKIVKCFKLTNNKKRLKNLTKGFYFENICEKGSCIDELIHEMNCVNIYNNHTVVMPKSYVYYIIKDHKYYIRFRIDIMTNCYFFELSVDELQIDEFHLPVNKNLFYKNDINEKILRKLQNLYKLGDAKLITYNLLTFPVYCTPTYIENVCPFFKVEIEHDKIFVRQISKIFSYFVRKNIHSELLYSENIYYIDEKCYNEFKELVNTIHEINKIERNIGIEMIFKLLLKNNLIEFLIRRILNRCKSAINILVAHILLLEKLIDKNELDMIIGKKDLNDDLRNTIIKNLMVKLISTKSQGFYFLKICLIIETEIFLNEKKNCKKGFFKDIKDIANIIEPGENINMIKILQELIKNHIFTFIKYKEEIIKNLCKIASLFTEKNYIILIAKHDTEQFDTIEYFNKLKIYNLRFKEDIKKIKEKLIENSKEDDKYEKEIRKTEDERKKIKKLLRKSPLANKLNKIKREALNKIIENIVDGEVNKNFEKNLKKQGFKKIKNTINEYVRRKLYDEVNEKTINEVENEIKEKFCSELKRNVQENIRKNALKYLPDVLIRLFVHNIKFLMNEKCTKELRNIRNWIGDQEILRILNGGVGIELKKKMVKYLEK
ncbi:uncharacterized protein VNE69_06035 [Vairimorpha necatrix]|uniref:Uncharacterized protein n=1 Tax=Vairimorpha necatrix TaxID=6039 RepID=A0AAX4JCP0_9MICR